MFFSTEALGSILGVYGPTSNLTERTCHRRPFPTHSSVSMHKLLHIQAKIAFAPNFRLFGRVDTG